MEYTRKLNVRLNKVAIAFEKALGKSKGEWYRHVREGGAYDKIFNLKALSERLVEEGTIKNGYKITDISIHGSEDYLKPHIDFRAENINNGLYSRHYGMYDFGREDFYLIDNAAVGIICDHYEQYFLRLVYAIVNADKRTPAEDLIEIFLEMANKAIDRSKYTAKIAYGKLNKETSKPYAAIVIEEDGDYMASLVFSNAEVGDSYLLEYRHILSGQSSWYFDLEDAEREIANALNEFGKSDRKSKR